MTVVLEGFVIDRGEGFKVHFEFRTSLTLSEVRMGERFEDYGVLIHFASWGVCSQNPGDGVTGAFTIRKFDPVLCCVPH